MARQLFIRLSGAVYHITNRANAKQDIFIDNTSRKVFLEVLTQIVERFNWLCHACSLVKTIDFTLSREIVFINKEKTSYGCRYKLCQPWALPTKRPTTTKIKAHIFALSSLIRFVYFKLCAPKAPATPPIIAKENMCTSASMMFNILVSPHKK